MRRATGLNEYREIVFTVGKWCQIWYTCYIPSGKPQERGASVADRHSPGYDADYKRANYDRLSLLVRKGKKQILKEVADSRGVSVNQLIIDAVESCYGIDLSED